MADSVECLTITGIYSTEEMRNKQLLQARTGPDTDYPDGGELKMTSSSYTHEINTESLQPDKKGTSSNNTLLPDAVILTTLCSSAMVVDSLCKIKTDTGQFDQEETLTAIKLENNDNLGLDISVTDNICKEPEMDVVISSKLETHRTESERENPYLSVKEEVEVGEVLEGNVSKKIAWASDLQPSCNLNMPKRNHPLTNFMTPEEPGEIVCGCGQCHEPEKCQCSNGRFKVKTGLSLDMKYADNISNNSTNTCTDDELHTQGEVNLQKYETKRLDGEKSECSKTARNNIVGKQYKCTMCDYRSHRYSALTNHTRIHTGEKPYTCTICNYRSALKGNLVLHLRTHTGEKPHKCTMCDYKSGNKSNLRQHFKTHTGEKPHKCTICDYRCILKSDLTRHIGTHSGEIRYKCDVCDYRCCLKSDLTRHMIDYGCSRKDYVTNQVKSHTEENPVERRDITQGFTNAQQGNLPLHARSYSGEKPHVCTICGYRCLSKATLNVHYRTHSGEKPYKCTMCDYSCSQKGHLTRHVRTHTGEKPYKCTMCDFRSSRNVNLRRHVRTHTD